MNPRLMNYRFNDIAHLSRIDPHQTAKGTCTYCNQRKGYDYELVPKKR